MQSRYLHQTGQSYNPRIVTSSALRSQAQQLSQQSDLSQPQTLSSGGIDSGQDNRYKPTSSSGYTLEQRYGTTRKEDPPRQPVESTYSRYTPQQNTPSVNSYPSGIISSQNSQISGTTSVISSGSRVNQFGGAFSGSTEKPLQTYSSQQKYSGFESNKPSSNIPEVTINLTQQFNNRGSRYVGGDTGGQSDSRSGSTSKMKTVSFMGNTQGIGAAGSNTLSSSLSSSVFTNPYASSFKTNYQNPITKPTETESEKSNTFTINYPMKMMETQSNTNVGISSNTNTVTNTAAPNYSAQSSAWSSRYNYTSLSKPTANPSPPPIQTQLPQSPVLQPTQQPSIPQTSSQLQPTNYPAASNIEQIPAPSMYQLVAGDIKTIISQQAAEIKSHESSQLSHNKYAIPQPQTKQAEVSIDVPHNNQISPIKHENQPTRTQLAANKVQFSQESIQHDSKISIQSRPSEPTSTKKQSSRIYDLFSTQRKINPPRFASESPQKLSSEFQRLREQNRILNRQLINLKVTTDNGRASELEMMKSENKQLRDQLATMKVVHEEKLQELARQNQGVRRELDEVRRARDQEVETYRRENQALNRRVNQMRETIQRLELQKHEQPKDLVGLRLELAKWEDNFLNLKLQHEVALERNKKCADQVQTYKTLMEKNKIADQAKDVQIESAQRKRIELQGQIVNLNNQIQRQKAEHQKAVSKHSDYQKQIFSLKSQCQQLNKQAQGFLNDKNELAKKVSELRLEKKNLEEYSRRNSNSQMQEQRLMEEKGVLIEQLKEKVEEVGQLKKRIAQMAAEMSRQRDEHEVTILKDKIAKLQLDNQKLRKYNKNPAGQFDEVLKSQLTEAQRYKQNLNQKTEEIYHLREEVNSAHSEIDQLLKQKQIDALKVSVERKNLMSQFNIERQGLQTEMQVLRNAIKMQEEKAKYWSQENKKKDEFMQNYLIGRIKVEEDKNCVKEFFRNYEAHLPRSMEYAFN